MILRLAIRNLSRNPRRTLLVFATLAVGAGMLLFFRAFNGGVLAEYREVSIHSRYGHGSVFATGFWGKNFEKPWEHWLENPAAVIAELEKSPDVAQVFPRLSFAALVTNGSKTFNGVGTAVDGVKEAAFFNRLTLNEGTPLDGSPDAILLGRGLARTIGAKPGANVTLLATTVSGSLNSGNYAVKGIFETGIQALDAVAFRLEFSGAQTLLDTTRAESVAVALKPGGLWSGVKKRVAAIAGGEAFSFEELDRTYYQNGVNWLKSQAGVFENIILLIVLLGIFNAVAVTVLERGPEIASARANGETRADVFFGIVLESALLALAAGLAGAGLVLVLGKGLLAKGITMPPAPGMTLPSQVFLAFRLEDAATVLALTVGISVAGSALVAVRILRGPIAARLRPA